jgi:Putative beta-barrel porin-2, OmpL-like. bbp2
MRFIRTAGARAAALLAFAVPVATLGQERPISLDAPSLGGARARLLGELEISGFAVGSASWNSAIQMVPEFAGGAAALADPRQVNFRFDKVGVALTKRFGPALSVSAAFEVESHKDKHSHLRTNPATQCINVPAPCEAFGAETPATESTLDKLSITYMPTPALGFGFGRYDVPFGIERHDEVLNMSATASEIYHFAKPQNFTGLQAFYQMGPLVDLNLWVANRWESHTTHEPFDDNNKSKSIGGRIGFSPGMRDALLNIGIGGWYGAERSDPANAANLGLNGPKRSVIDVDASFSPSSRSAYVAEVVWGKEEKVSFRARGWPVEAPAETDITPKWLGGFVMAHQEVGRSLGLTARYGYLHDQHAWRTGVAQGLQSLTLTSTLHLSALAGKAPLAVAYPRTQVRIHEVDLKIEYRYNRSNQPVFADAVAPLGDEDPKKSSHQVQLQAAINF